MAARVGRPRELGEQRVLLLVRALVKNPPLLLLDEPCQGLDKFQTQRFTSIVDDICRHFNKTLIYVSHYANEMPACPERGNAGRADAAERVEHNVALKSVQLDAAVAKLDRERGGVPDPRRRLGRQVPDALCVQ